VQIAGLIARRILCDVKEGDHVQAGGRFGIIRFGSRTDIYLPAGVLPLVAEGQTMIGGESVIADLSGELDLDPATVAEPEPATESESETETETETELTPSSAIEPTMGSEPDPGMI
jgi:hypothetical protein